MMTTIMLLNMSTKLQLVLHRDWNGLSISANLVSLGKISQKIPKTVLTLNTIMSITNAIAKDFQVNDKLIGVIPNHKITFIDLCEFFR
jgi:hypothetical protein